MVSAIFAVILLAGFNATVATTPSIEIGAIVTQSTGDVAAEAMRLAVNKVNSGNLTVARVNLTVINAESKFEALRAACELLRKGVHAVVGPAYSSHALAVAPLFTATNVPFISYSATSTSLSANDEYPTFGRVVPSDFAQSAVIASVVHSFSWTSMCILFEDSNYGTNGAMETAAQARKLGIRIILLEPYSATTSDTTNASKVAEEAGCRIFALWCVDCGVALEGVRQSGLLDGSKYAWILSDGCAQTSEFNTSILRSAAIGTLCVTPASDRWGPGRADFAQRAADSGVVWNPEASPLSSNVPSVYAGFSFDAVLGAIHAVQPVYSHFFPSAFPPFTLPSSAQCLERVNETQQSYGNGSAIMAALSGVSFVGATSAMGNVTFTTKRERVEAVYNISNMQSVGVSDGQFMPVGEAIYSSSPSPTVEVRTSAGEIMSKSTFPGQWSRTFGSIPESALNVSGKHLKIIIPTENIAPFQFFDTVRRECLPCTTALARCTMGCEESILSQQWVSVESATIAATVTNSSECCSLCGRTSGCAAWSFSSGSGVCYGGPRSATAVNDSAWESGCNSNYKQVITPDVCPTVCYKGISAETLERVSAVLNFTYSISALPNGYGYTSILEDCIAGTFGSNCSNEDAGSYDVAVGDFTATALRSAFADISFPYYDTGLAMVVVKTASNDNSGITSRRVWNIFQPFTTQLWIYIVVWMIGMALLFWLFEHGINVEIEDWESWSSRHFRKIYKNEPTEMQSWGQGNENLPNAERGALQKRRASRAAEIRRRETQTGELLLGEKRKSHIGRKMRPNHSGLLNSFYWGVTAFTQSPDITPVTAPGKFLVIGYLITVVILLASYTANLASILSRNEAINLGFNGYTDVPSKYGYETVCLQGLDGSIEQYWHTNWGVNARLDKTPPCFNCGCDSDSECPIPYASNGVGYDKRSGWTFQRCISELLDPASPVKVVMGDAPILENYVLHNASNCGLAVAGGRFYNQGFSFMMKKDSYLTRSMSTAILTLRELADIEKIKSTNFGPVTCDATTTAAIGTSTDDLQRLSPEDMAGCFIISLIMVGIAMIDFVYEQIDAAKRSKNLESEPSDVSHAPNVVSTSAMYPGFTEGGI